MRSLALAATFAALSAPALAASPFDGTWKADMATAKFPDTPDTYLLQAGVYHCTTCKPPVSVKADGQLHPISGNPAIDAVSVKIINSHTTEHRYAKAGKVTGITTRTVSADGQSLHYASKDLTSPNGQPVDYSGEEMRVAAGPAGAHAISGTWRYKPQTATASENGLVAKITLGDGMYHIAMLNGSGLDAKVGGPPAQVKGDVAGTMAAITMPNPRTLVETDTIKGKVQAVSTLTLAPDGRALTLTTDDKIRNEKTAFTLVKQ